MRWKKLINFPSYRSSLISWKPEISCILVISHNASSIKITFFYEREDGDGMDEIFYFFRPKNTIFDLFAKWKGEVKNDSLLLFPLFKSPLKSWRVQSYSSYLILRGFSSHSEFLTERGDEVKKKMFFFFRPHRSFPIYLIDFSTVSRRELEGTTLLSVQQKLMGSNILLLRNFVFYENQISIFFYSKRWRCKKHISFCLLYRSP